MRNMLVWDSYSSNILFFPLKLYQMLSRCLEFAESNYSTISKKILYPGIFLPFFFHFLLLQFKGFSYTLYVIYGTGHLAFMAI